MFNVLVSPPREHAQKYINPIFQFNIEWIIQEQYYLILSINQPINQFDNSITVMFITVVVFISHVLSYYVLYFFCKAT